MEAFEAITTRHSCRDYIVRQLSEEQTEKLIRAANAAPAASAQQNTVPVISGKNKNTSPSAI